MSQHVFDKVRVQILHKNIVRIEQMYQNGFCDQNTYFVPSRDCLGGYPSSCQTDEHGNNVVVFNDYKLVVPNGAQTLANIQLYHKDKLVYTYKSISNSGELPVPHKTPAVFALADKPRLLMPANGYTKGARYPLHKGAKDTYLLLCQGNHGLLRQLYVQLTGRTEMVRLSTLGLWNSRYFEHSDESARQLLCDYAKHDVPLDVMVLDTDWRKASDRGIGYEVNTQLIPRGKQRWEKSNFGCWYVDIAGIYKTAWLEVVHKNHIQGVKITPNLSDGSVSIDFTTTNQNGQLQAAIWYKNQLVEQLTTPAKNNHVVANLSKNLHLWEQGEGNLYDLQLDLVCDGTVVDSVGSYFGMREISIQDGRVLLNGKPLYQRLVLDQGYWPQSALTPPSEQSLEQDITLTLQMGFNGARKHQKVEDERYLYYADVYGFIVWAEMPSMYDFTEQSAQNFQREWLLAVHQQYNHPCILCWVPFNESWGVEHILTDKTQQDFVNKVYHATKQIDSMRPVITNDGWEHTISDFVTLHHYTQDGATLTKAFGDVAGCVGGPWLDHDRQTFAQGYLHQGQPILLTEFGGTSFVKDTFGGNWGYGSAVANDAEYLARLGNLVDSIRALPHMQGFCYTQLTDVYQEVNGLLYFDRTPKQPLTSFAQIFGNKGNK